MDELSKQAMKINLGCGPTPIHDQHLKVMEKYGDDWTLVDLYAKDSSITNWNATDLPLEDGTVEVIYTSHLLEHLPHVQTRTVLSHWYNKLQKGGTLIINVPDLEWACRQVIKKANGGLLDGYYNQWEGEHGLLSVIYGSQSHEGEYHKAGFLADELTNILSDLEFKVKEVNQGIDAHEMGIIYLVAEK
jgi:predicted SAM-dependent methyltransferase